MALSVITLGLSTSQSWAAIQSTGTLLLQGRVPETVRMELSEAAAHIDLAAGASATNERVGEFDVLYNTDLMPLAIERMASPGDDEVFIRPPQVSAENCRFETTEKTSRKNVCTIRASWKTRKHAKNGIHPLWVRLTLSSI